MFPARGMLTAVLFAALAVCAAPLHAQAPFRAQFVAGGLGHILSIAHAPGDATRLFLVVQEGRILVLENEVVLPTPFLDITGTVQSGGERGLLGLCFDPDYASNGFFYVSYNEAAGNSVVARYHVTANPNVADASSAFSIARIPLSGGIHRGGWIDFGADGYLYMSIGEGGTSTRSQDPAVLPGKMLRLDVTGDDFPADAQRNYRIPPTNPFVGQPNVAPEIFALGLRNPWRCSFDRLTHDLYIGDVGASQREEINILPAGTSGQNFGWPCMEGTLCTASTSCTCNAPTLTLPIHEFDGTAVVGGRMYRGSAIAGLAGTYFFADYGSATRIWSFRYDGATLTAFTERTAQLVTQTGQVINLVAALGEDLDGELYIADLGGELFKIVPIPDTIAPQVAITAPTSASAFDTVSSPLTLAGTASDTTQVTQVTWTSSAGGSGSASGTTSWSIAGLVLAPGANSFTVTAHDAAGNSSAASIDVRYFPPAESFCAGDGSLVACPCGNSGASGHGCANSLFASGGLLVAGGSATVSGDNASLIASELSGQLAIFVQGSTQQAPALIDDGLFCVGTPIVRLGRMPVGGNAAVYPDNGALPIAQRGFIPGAGGDYTYQVFYRNAAATFCPPATSNRTNGVILHWIP
jgi:glucose/arabinose dehydrogenase